MSMSHVQAVGTLCVQQRTRQLAQCTRDVSARSPTHSLARSVSRAAHHSSALLVPQCSKEAALRGQGWVTSACVQCTHAALSALSCKRPANRRKQQLFVRAGYRVAQQQTGPQRLAPPPCTAHNPLSGTVCTRSTATSLLTTLWEPSPSYPPGHRLAAPP